MFCQDLVSCVSTLTYPSKKILPVTNNCVSRNSNQNLDKISSEQSMKESRIHTPEINIQNSNPNENLVSKDLPSKK